MSNSLHTQEPSKTVIKPEYLLTSLLESARHLLSFDNGALALWDAEREVLVPFYGDSSQRLAEAPEIVPVSDGLIGYVARTRQPICIADVTNDARYLKVHDSTRSEMAVPILLNDQLLGVFNIESSSPHAYHDSHLAILQALANQAAVVIETTRLYTRLRDNYDQLRDAHSDMMLRNEISRLATSDLDLQQRLPQLAWYLNQFADAEACVIVLWEEGQSRPWCSGDWCQDADSGRIRPAAEIITHVLLETGKSMILNDLSSPTTDKPFQIEGIESVMALPLIARRRTCGAVVLFRILDRRPFLAQNLQRLQASLDQIALGIDNQQLLINTQAHLEESRALLELADIAARSMSIEEMTHQALTLTRTILQVQAGALLVFDRYSNMLIPLIDGFGLPDKFYQMQFPVSSTRSLAAITFNVGHSQYVNNLATLTGLEKQVAYEADLQNMLIAPLRVQDHPLGVFIVANRASGFSANDARLLTAIGSHIASALRNIEYLERVRLFKGLSDVVRRVSAELVGEQVLIAACQSIVEAIEGVDHAGIVLNDRAPTSGIVVAEYPAQGGIGQRLRLEGYAIYQQMLQTLTPVVVNDMVSAHDLLGPNYDILLGLGIKSLMVVPLIVQNEFIGSIGVDSTHARHQFTAAEIEVMSAVAAQLAVTIRNSELFEQLEARTLELSEANRLKSEFLAKMSHELRTPMNSILGFSETLLSNFYGELNEKQRDRIERIRRGGRNLLALIDDLLDLSKIEAGRMQLEIQRVNLADEVRACILEIESQVQSKNLFLQFVSPDWIPTIVADPLRLRQVVNNLLSNAIKFTKAGGITVTINVHRFVDEMGEDYEEIWTSVADTGIGIDPDDFEIIFDEFRQADGSTTRQFGGTGLGLAISRRLIEMMGGRIWLESEIGKGSVFTFALPTI